VPLLVRLLDEHFRIESQRAWAEAGVEMPTRSSFLM
jgi:hypothetical protein